MGAQPRRQHLLKVSEFSALGQVTVKALHLYDRLGLLVPARVDPDTGYRLYSLDQLPRLNRILALKELGFSLGEIRRMLDEAPSATAVQEMLTSKRRELERHVVESQQRLSRVDARLRQIEREGAPARFDVGVKEVPPMLIASARRVEPDVYSMVRRTYEVGDLIRASNARIVGPTRNIFHFEGFRERDLDVEIALPVADVTLLDSVLSDGRQVTIRTLQRVSHMAYVIWCGDGPSLTEAYSAIVAWISENGYRVVGPPREVYLRDGEQSEKMFEIQYPIGE